MASYLNQNGNSIGSLLRFIQEQKSQSPINPQSSEVGSPIRDVVQEPLSGSEGKGTSKVVSLRPEGTLTPSGQEAKDATPQSSRIGPISIGGQGDVTQTPTNVVAANEPGPGFGIPSASKTVGDVMNKTAGASARPPALGTTIKSKTPTTLSGAPVAESIKGQGVTNYNYARDKANADKTAEDIKLGVAAGERSIPETQAKLDELIARQDALQGELTAEDQALLDRPLSDRALAEARSQRDKFLAARGAMNITPTPTPSPMQGQSSGGSGGSSGGGSGQSSGGQSRPTQSIAPKIMMSSSTNKQAANYKVPMSSSTNSSAANYRPSTATQSVAPKQTPAKQSAPSKPSIGTTITNAFKKLFGR